MLPGVTTNRRSAVITLGFVVSVVLAGVISWSVYGISDTGTSLFCYPLICTLPIFAVLNWILRKRGKLGIVLPLLVLPLLFILFFARMIYERTPQYMFKTYVTDPIPAGVTNIQGRYIDQFIFEDVVITFQTTPEVIDAIIAKYDFKRNDILDGYPDKDLPEYSWKGQWVGYERDFYRPGGGLSGYIRMWVDLEQFIVVFRVSS